MSEPRRTVITSLAIAALAAPLIAFAVLLAVPSLDPVIMAFEFHFYVVGLTAVAAAIACAVVIASAKTLRQTRLLFLGLGFFAIAGIFAVHGLETPGFIADEYYASVSVSAWLSVFAGAAFISLSAIGLPRRVEEAVERNGQTVFAAACVAIVAYVGLSMFVERWLEWVPIDNRPLQWALGLSAMALTAFAMWRYYQSYAFARLPSQLGMLVALTLLLEVSAIILWGRVWHLSWWLYHSLYGAAFVVLFSAWAVEVRRAGTLRAIADALSMRDALAQLDRGLDAPIVELVDAVEAKDVQTFGHVRRVSGYALAIGRRMGLAPGELRSLVLAAQMHDVGKISIPNSILAKPGPLTDEEFGVVKTHTQRGGEIAEKVASLRSLADVIRHHHERLDGSGYPDALAGERIPLLARIIAVADTYDAITSSRPYRMARSHVEAMGEITRLRGVQFDPQCVDAFLAVCEEEGTRIAEDVAA